MFIVGRSKLGRESFRKSSIYLRRLPSLLRPRVDLAFVDVLSPSGSIRIHEGAGRQSVRALENLTGLECRVHSALRILQAYCLERSLGPDLLVPGRSGPLRHQYRTARIGFFSS